MATPKTSTARRREVRRSIPKPGQAVFGQLWSAQVGWALVFLSLIAVGGGLLALGAQRGLRNYVGQVMPQAVVARVKFRAVDHQMTQEKRADARDREPAVYVPNTDYLREVEERLIGLVGLGAKESIDQVPVPEREAIRLTPQALAELRAFHESPAAWRQLVHKFMEGFACIAVLSGERSRVERDPSERAARITAQHPTLPEMDRYDNVLISVEDDLAALRESVIALVGNQFPSDLARTVTALVMQNPRPVYRFDEVQTRHRRNARFELEEPAQITYQPNDILIPEGKRLEPLDLQLLNEELAQYQAGLGPLRLWLRRVGWFGMFAMIGLGLWGYILTYQPRISRNAMRGLAITVLMLAGQALAVGATGMQPKLIFATATLPTLLVTIILTIAYEQRFALAVGAAHTLLVLVSLDLPMSFGMVLLSGMAVAVSQLSDVRHRSTLVRAGAWSGLTMGLATLLVGLADRSLHLSGQFDRIGYDVLFAFSAGIGTGLVVQGILPMIEKMFDVTTSMTLRELNDASHPLLRRLAEEAPGTYQHSLRLADMAESSADAIGANGLLCKVGAMYHDIGKINKPSYFIENQGGGPNRHNKLSPAMSLLIIVGHVKDGIEMAREYGLPRVLRHFIESHHGTTLVEYFYHAAKQKRDAENQPAPAEFEFRYPGPKPQSREAAILMLCDGVEGAARTLDEPTTGRIEQLTHAMASKRLMDGQFDDSDLTLQELHKIEQSIVRTLCATYHGRVKYPSDKKDDTPQTATAAS